jgi:hypothetical protein
MNDGTQADAAPTLGQRLLRIGVIFGLVAAAICGLAGAVWGMPTALVAAVTAVVCGAGALLGHLCSELPRGDLFIMLRLATSSLVRVGLPLILLLVTRALFPEHFGRGMVYFVILFYVVGLLIDLKLQIRKFRPVSASSRQALGTPAAGDS